MNYAQEWKARICFSGQTLSAHVTWHPLSHFLAARGRGRPKPPSGSLSCERNPSKPWAVEAPKMQNRWLGLQLGFGGTGTMRVFAGASMRWPHPSWRWINLNYKYLIWEENYITSRWTNSSERRTFVLFYFAEFQRGEWKGGCGIWNTTSCKWHLICITVPLFSRIAGIGDTSGIYHFTPVYTMFLKV